MNENDLKTVRSYTRKVPAPRAAPSEPTKFATSATFAARASKPDAEAYARALVPVVRRWCDRPLEVARWLVRILESEGT